MTREEYDLVQGLQRLGSCTRDREAPYQVEQALVAAFRARAGRKRWVGIALAASLAFFVVHTRAPERPRITNTDLAEGFIALPNAEVPPADDAVNVVRLEVPRS